MVEIETTKMSSKGQIVIPSNFRKHIKEGDTLIVMKNKDQIILKLATDMDKQMAEDLEFARRTEEAWNEIESGKGKKYTLEEFKKRLNDLSKNF